MAAKVQRWPNAVTLIFVRAKRSWPNAEELIIAAADDFKKAYPEKIENINLLRGKKFWHEETEELFMKTLGNAVKTKSVSKATEVELGETLDATIRFVRKHTVKGGAYFFIMSTGKITTYYKQIMVAYNKVPTRPIIINWEKTGLVVVNANKIDMAMTEFPRR
jgi:hypothetical protein